MTGHDTAPCYGCTQRSEMCHTKEYGRKPYQAYIERKTAERAEREKQFWQNLNTEGYIYDQNTRARRRKHSKRHK